MGSIEQQTSADPQITAGRSNLWLVFLLPLAVTAVFAAIGAARYAGMPDVIPTHWGPDGTADAYSDKSFWSVFGPLLIGPGAALFFAFIALMTSAVVPATPKSSQWTQFQREGSHRAVILSFGVIAALIALLVGIVCEAAWRQVSSFAPWPVAVFVVVVLAVVMVSFPAGKRWAQSRARAQGIEPTPEEAAEDSKWVAGGLYRDAADPRVLVSKREGHGIGSTINIGSRGGKALGIGLLLVVLAVPFGITIATLVG